MRGDPRALLLLLAAACGVETDTSAPRDGGGTSPTVNVTLLGPAGGAAVGDGASVIVPAGALSFPAGIGARRVSEPPIAVPAGVRLVTAVYALTPHGFEFAKPVTVFLPYPDQGTAIQASAVMRLEEGGEAWEPVAGWAVVSGRIRFSTTTFRLRRGRARGGRRQSGRGVARLRPRARERGFPPSK